MKVKVPPKCACGKVFFMRTWGSRHLLSLGLLPIRCNRCNRLQPAQIPAESKNYAPTGSLETVSQWVTSTHMAELKALRD